MHAHTAANGAGGTVASSVRSIDIAAPAAETAARVFLEALGLPVDSDGMRETPGRMARAYRFGNVASQLKQFIDSLGGLWFKGQLADKIYSGFTASSTKHGGQESTLLALYNTVHHFGGIIVSPGYTDPVKLVDGNPYGRAMSTITEPLL
jgi:hypothetical protein